MLIDIHRRHPDIDGFRFCRKIMRQYHPTNNRPHINHVCIRSGYAYSTDGQRLHSFECAAQYHDGLYAITVCRVGFVQIAKSQYGASQFPLVDNLFDDSGCIELENGKYFRLDGIDYSDAVFCINRHGIKINPKFVSDIGGYFKIIVTADKSRLDSKPVIFVCGNKRAAIMPMRLY